MRLSGFVLLLLLTAGMAHGQTAASAPLKPYCLPSDTKGGLGSDHQTFETADVSGEVGWCPSSDGGWHITVHQYCLKTICGKPPLSAAAVITGAITRVLHAANPASQAQAEWATAGIPLKTDLERWQYQSWLYQACQWLTATQPGVSPRPTALPIALPKKSPTDVTAPLPPLTYCEVWKPGAAPAPPADTWLVTAAGSVVTRPAYPLVAGKRGLISDNTAKTGTVCDCVATKLPESFAGGLIVVTYCAVLPASLTAPSPLVHVAACTLKK